MPKYQKTGAALLCAAAMTLTSCGENSGGRTGTDGKAEALSTEYPEQVFWGDTHLHTSNSIDAFGFGNRLDAEAALRFARGEKVTSTKGVEAKLDRPLDFLVIADHAAAMGATKALYEAPRMFIHDDFLLRWYDMMHESEEGSLQVTAELIDGAANGTLPESLTDVDAQSERVGDLWREHGKLIDNYNEPGKFTAFMGFEYTPMPQGNNQHRVVMFRDGSDKVTKVIPFASTVSPDPEDLWAYMDDYETNTGGKALAIPHNSNVSGGTMFAATKADGSPIDQAYAQSRAKHEPIVEVTQIKGDSESHPFLSPNDEFASFGVAGWDKANLSATLETTDAMQEANYVRSALKNGMKIMLDVGVNPFKFGMIGSTDSHTSLATADEDSFFGKHTGNEPSEKDRAITPQNLGTRMGRFGWHYLSSGYAAVWATSNTREAIFDAMQRRETYATTGPRMTVRLFGGWDFTADDMDADWVKAGYARGVPMGGDLSGGEGKAPTFMVSALMDPEGANLDRVQIVKGWVDAEGEVREKIYDIAWSDMENRRPGADGKVPAVGSTVDLSKPGYDNSIGAAELATFWQDPDFDADSQAFYYVRVLEIPTPRWPVYDAVKYGFTLPDEVIKVHQERAYSSPIWYTPKG